jgi:hypothetical protein
MIVSCRQGYSLSLEDQGSPPPAALARVDDSERFTVPAVSIPKTLF